MLMKGDLRLLGDEERKKIPKIKSFKE